MDILSAALSAKRHKAQAAREAAHSRAWLAEKKNGDLSTVKLSRHALLAFGPVTQAAWAAWGNGTVDPTPIIRNR